MKKNINFFSLDMELLHVLNRIFLLYHLCIARESKKKNSVLWNEDSNQFSMHCTSLYAYIKLL